MHPAAKLQLERAAREYSLWRSVPEEADAGVAQWLAKFVDVGKPTPTGRLLMTLNEATGQSFSYTRRSSDGTQIPLQTIRRQEGKKGICPAHDGGVAIAWVHCALRQRLRLGALAGWFRSPGRRFDP